MPLLPMELLRGPRRARGAAFLWWKKKTRSVRAQGTTVKSTKRSSCTSFYCIFGFTNVIILCRFCHLSCSTIFTHFYNSVLCHSLPSILHHHHHHYHVVQYVICLQETESSTDHLFLSTGLSYLQATSPRDRTTIPRCVGKTRTMGNPVVQLPSQWVSSHKFENLFKVP